MLASRQFGCKAFCLSLRLVILHPLPYFVTTKVLSISQQIQFSGRGPNILRSICTTSRIWCMIGQLFCNTSPQMSRLHIFSPRTLLRKSSLTSVHCWGWVPWWIQIYSSVFFSLSGFFSHWVFLFSSLSICFEHFRVTFCIGWPMAFFVEAIAFF